MKMQLIICKKTFLNHRRVIPCQDTPSGYPSSQICPILFITDYYRWKWNIKAISQLISELSNREVVNLVVGWKADDFPKSRFWAYGMSYRHEYTSGRVFGGAEHYGNTHFAIKQFLICETWENVKIWKWKVSKFREEFLPTPSRYRGFIGTNSKYKPWIFWKYKLCIGHFRYSTLTSITKIGKLSKFHLKYIRIK